jgi:NAD(P)-dependent dehydrogenase (short-subunit alcohol dehydrogenase family)
VNLEDIAGRAAFITGGAQGIGLGIARALTAAGAKVAIADINDDALEVAGRELAAGSAAMAVTLDVRDRDAFATVADRVESELGPVSLLFNNAGVAGATQARNMSYETWDWVIGINLQGVYNGIQTFVPRMIERGAGGYIVNTASGAGLVHASSGFLYATSKFGVVGLSEALHDELSRDHIGVSVLCPGPVATDIVRNTANLDPAGDVPSDAVEEALARSHEWLAKGTPPDVVGRMVLDAICADRLHILTDEMIADMVAERSQRILDALPSALDS